MYNNLWLVNGQFQPYITSFTTIREPGFKPWMCLKMGYTSNYSHVNSSKTGDMTVIGGMPHFQKKNTLGTSWRYTSISNPHSQKNDDIKPPYQTHILKMMMISNLHIKPTFSKWWWYQTSISKPRSQIGGIPPYQTHIPDAKCWLLKVKWWFHWRYTPWTSMGILHLKWWFPIGFRAALLTRLRVTPGEVTAAMVTPLGCGHPRRVISGFHGFHGDLIFFCWECLPTGGWKIN